MDFFRRHIDGHLEAVSALSNMSKDVESAGKIILSSLQNGGKIMLCGNGGSAADAQHIAAELVGQFRSKRRGLAAIALTTDTSALTAVANDMGYDLVFARQVSALAQQGDVLICISTSGESVNVIKAAKAANLAGCSTIGLLGGTGGLMKTVVDFPLIVPVKDTAHVQECHIMIGHIWCTMIDLRFESGQ